MTKKERIDKMEAEIIKLKLRINELEREKKTYPPAHPYPIVPYDPPYPLPRPQSPPWRITWGFNT